VDVAKASAELDAFIERRAEGRDARDTANEHHEIWQRSVRVYHARDRERNRWAWIRHFDRMARNHAAIAQDYERRATELVERGA
jgi:hypothetical protein